MPSEEQLLICPRPSSPKALEFLTKSIEKVRKSSEIDDLTLLEKDELSALQTYWKDVPREDHKDPGTDPKLDAELSAWLRDNASWVPLKVLLTSTSQELEAAGYPSAQVEAFRTSFRGFEEAEHNTPGQVAAARRRTGS